MKERKELWKEFLKLLICELWPEIIALILGIVCSIAAEDSFGKAILNCGAFVLLSILAHMWFLAKRDPEIQKKNIARKYNNFMYTCPMCGSHKIRDITSGKKAVTIGMVGVASSNFGKNYQCDNCNYKW